MNMFKIGTLLAADEVECHYDNIYQVQDFPTWSRMAIGARDKQISLMLEIAKSWQGPYGVLYVLLVSRLGKEPGRYQNPEPCNFNTLEALARTFQEYLERDGRHHLWFMDLPSRSQLVYDNHNIIYAYGDIAWYSQFLDKKGFSRQDVKIACPHTHNYNREFDEAEDRILKHWEWKHFPLQEDDDP
jgi:hypothetical protein